MTEDIHQSLIAFEALAASPKSIDRVDFETLGRGLSDAMNPLGVTLPEKSTYGIFTPMAFLAALNDTNHVSRMLSSLPAVARDAQFLPPDYLRLWLPDLLIALSFLNKPFEEAMVELAELETPFELSRVSMMDHLEMNQAFKEASDQPLQHIFRGKINAMRLASMEAREKLESTSRPRRLRGGL